jgi:mannose-6-phosphate isomerase-like protein (cupin superfamily)
VRLGRLSSMLTGFHVASYGGGTDTLWMRRAAVTNVLAPPLRDHKLALPSSGLVLAEWSAAGAPSGGPQYQAPLHLHHDDDEAWYVLEGRLRVRIGDTDHDVPAGAAVIGPHGIPHTFWNPDPAPVRYVIVMSSQTSSLLDALHGGGQLSPGEVRQLFAAHGCQLLG